MSAAPAVATANVPLISMQDLRAGERRSLAQLFHASIFPLLTPLAVDITHPLRPIAAGTLAIVTAVSGTLGDAAAGVGDRRLVAAGNGDDLRAIGAKPAVVLIPPAVDQLLVLDRGHRDVGVGGEELVQAHLDSLFPGLSVISSACFRVHALGGEPTTPLDTDGLPTGITVTSWADADLVTELLGEALEVLEVRLVASLHRPDPIQSHTPSQVRTRTVR